MAAAVSPTLLAVLTIGGGALVLGILIGIYTMPVNLTPELEAKLSSMKRLSKEYYKAEDPHQLDQVYRALIDGPDPVNIRKNIRFLSAEPHQAGMERDEQLAEFYRAKFLEFGLDRAYTVPYRVLLSYANPERFNKIYLMDTLSNEALFISQHLEGPVRAEEMNSKAIPAYHSYSPKGDVSGQPVYCNYGRVEDFELLIDEARIDLNEKICIIRYGKAYRGNKIANAARFGCKAVILFSDPELVAPFDTKLDSVYPNSIWMNGKAMQRGNVRLISGDPLTPGFPSIEGGYRKELDDEEVQLPKIPSQPIGYDDAKAILKQMDGLNTADDIRFQNWTGRLNITYKLGPGFTNEHLQLRIVINNELTEKVIYNVIGVLDGHLEPDRYVIVGNHRDAWGFGAMDAASGGAAMLESAKSFGHHHNQTGWRPRRSLVFASWSAEEFGMVGSTEWVEELKVLLSAKAVAYLNVDTCVSGPLLKPDVSPSLAEALRAATKLVPAHKESTEHQLKPNQTLYDSWSQSSGTLEDDKIKVNTLGSGTDHVPFTFFAGVPSINIEFQHDKKKFPVGSYPAYHTGYETFYMVEHFIDPDFTVHQTCSRLISILLYSLSCSGLIPIQLDELSQQVVTDYYRQNVSGTHLSQLPNYGATVNRLEQAIKEFDNSTNHWTRYIQELNETNQLKNDPYQLRFVNDVAMSVERVFTDYSGRTLYKRPDTRNLLYGTSLNNFYQTILFPGISDLIDGIQQQESEKVRNAKLDYDELNKIQLQIGKLEQELRRHLTEIIGAFNVASKMLTRMLI